MSEESMFDEAKPSKLETGKLENDKKDMPEYLEDST